MNIPLTPPPGLPADEWARIASTSKRAATNPLWNDRRAVRRVLEFMDHWIRDKQSLPIQLDCRIFSKQPATVRQEFYNAKGALANNPELRAEMEQEFGERFAPAWQRLNGNTAYGIKDTFLTFSLGLSTADGNPYIQHATVVQSSRLSLKARFEEWLAGDMETRFEAAGEQINDELETQLKTIAAAYDDVIAYAITPTSLVAAKIS